MCEAVSQRQTGRLWWEGKSEGRTDTDAVSDESTESDDARRDDESEKNGGYDDIENS